MVEVREEKGGNAVLTCSLVLLSHAFAKRHPRSVSPLRKEEKKCGL
jgi:hypothetical protein